MMSNRPDSRFSVPAVASFWVSVTGLSLIFLLVPVVTSCHLSWTIILPGATAVVLGVTGIIDYRRRPSRKKDLLCALTGLIMGALLTWFCASALHDQPGRSSRPSCANNLHQIGLAVDMYAKEHAGKFPPVQSWNSAVSKYLRNKQVLYCPEAGESTPSYAMNRRLSGLIIGDVVDPVNTVLIYESIPGINSFGGPALFPSPARHGGDSPDYLVLFCDLHVKAVNENDIDKLNWDPKKKGKPIY